MARNNHNDWTDELREMIDGVELSPSENGWERLEADLRPRKAVWWPYAVSAAACLLLGGVFLFRERPSENVLDVVSPAPSAMVAEATEPQDEINDDGSALTAGEVLETVPPSATEEGGPLAVGSAKQTSSSTSPAAEPAISSNLFEDSLMPEETSEIVSPSSTDEEGPLAVKSPEQTSSEASGTAETSQFQPFDFGDEPIAHQRKQRRKITVTVSAGGAFGSAGNGTYFAQASPVTKADGEVMDITEVIQHSTPRQTALGLSIPVSDRMDICTGIDHMELNSVVGFGSQNLEWLGVPLRLGYHLADWGTSSISLGAGFKGEKCLSASLLGMDYTEPFQWAANMGADCRVRIFGPVSFSLTPELSYYFTDTVLPTYRTDHPLTFTLRAGLSLNL